ncbi:unnamed protein product [Nippostrongylus brasiliensis]|uniref:Thioredoxin-like_fold domain-containing protein n=1 Tax=Nippostrongylus brasiliensis TaxID=27835 RepID=A0A0N4XTF7_NIPBR|nr:unnamed protein product [Nippostrongylus brasiliensis]
MNLANPVLKIYRFMEGPPNPAEAEMNIHQHMQSLLLSSRQSQNIARLPSTIYRADGQISDVYWRNGIGLDKAMAMRFLDAFTTKPPNHKNFLGHFPAEKVLVVAG